MPVILKNNANNIEIDINPNLKYSVSKGDFDLILEDTGQGTPMVFIVLRSKAITENFIKLDWREVSPPPEVNNAEELRDLIWSWNVQQSQETTVTKIDSSTDNVMLMDENESRKMATIYNDSTAYLYIKYGEDASVDSFTLKIGPGDYLELPSPCYLGRIDGFWSGVNGSAMITEIS